MTNDAEPMVISASDESLTHDTWVVLGAAGEVHGILGFASFEDWREFAYAAEHGLPAPDSDRLILFFWTSSEVERGVRRSLREHGYSHDAYFPQVRRTRNPSWVRLVEDPRHARTLALATRAIASFASQHLAGMDPHGATTQLTYPGPFGGTVSLTYHGWVDPATGLTRPGGDLPYDMSSQLPAPPPLAFPFDHRFYALILTRDQLMVFAASAGSQDLARSLPGNQTVECLVVRATLADARRGAAALGEIETLIAVIDDTDDPPSCMAVAGTASGPTGAVTDGPAAVGLFESIEERVGGEDGTIWFLVTGGGVRGGAHGLDPRRCVLARPVRFTCARVSEIEAQGA